MAKQVNKPFLITLTILLAFGIVGTFVGMKWWKQRNKPKPEQMLAQGDALMAEKRYEEAAGKFSLATVGSPNNPKPITRVGDALYQLSKVEPEYLPKALAYWNQALQIDPTYSPAMLSKLNALIEEMEAYQRPRNFIDVRDMAAQLIKIDPSNKRAASYQYIATLSAWFNNVQTDPAVVRDSMEGLRSLAKADPSDPALPYHIARAQIQLGQDAYRESKPDLGNARFSEAARTMEEAITSQPGNVLMLLRAGQVFHILDLLVPRAESKGAYARQAKVLVDRARALVRPEDGSYQEVQTVYAAHQLQVGDKSEAERVYRDLLSRFPDETGVRLVLADILQADRSTRKEAADLLADTVQRGERPTAPRTAMARVLQLRAMVRLASIRMDLLEEIREPAAYKATLQQVEADVAKAESKTAEGPETLKIRGRLFLIKGDIINAVQTLSKALQLLDQVTARRDSELLYSLARAQLAAQQNEEARKLLVQVIASHPSYMPARYLLVDLLLNSNEIAEAAVHIDELEKQSPNSPLVARFRLLTLDPTKDKAEAERWYARLPEENRAQQVEKARLAIGINKLDEGIRLLELIRQASPNDPRIYDRLGRLQIARNDRPKARQIIEEGLKISPKDPPLTLLLARVDNATAEDIIGLTIGLIEGSTDPLSKSIQLAEVERIRGNAKAMYENLIAAEKLAPNDSRVQEQLFSYYLATKQYDAAFKYIEPLTKSNYGGSYGLMYWWKYYVSQRDYTNAIRIGREFTAKMPEFATSWITLGQALKLNKQFDEGLRAYNIALDRQKSNRDALRGAIDCLYELKRFDEAKKLITTARQFYPTDLGLAEMELEFDLKYGDPRNAEATLLKNLKDNSNQIQHYLNVASLYYRFSTMPNMPPDQAVGYLGKGIDTLKQAIEKFPDQMQPYVSLAELQNLSQKRGDAEATLRQMTEQSRLKDLAEPKLMLAEFYLKGNEPDKAEQPLRAAVAQAPKSAEIRRKFAVYLSQRNRVDEALKVLSEAPEKGEFDPVLLTARLEIKAAANRFAETEADCIAALADHPNEANWIAILANAQLQQGKFDAAIVSADRALTVEPRNSRALIARAMSKMRRSGADMADAIPDLIAYRDLNPGDTKVRLLLAEVFTARQRPDDAMRELEIALQGAPGDAVVRATLLDLYRQSQPPRWTEGDQVVKEAQAVESLVKDPGWITVEANWLLQRKEFQRAVDKSRQAIALAPKEPKYVQAFLGVLLNSKNETLLLRETDAMLSNGFKPWWVYQARGMARKSMNDYTRADQEFRQGFAAALAEKDQDAAESIVRIMGQQIGADKALALIEPRLTEDSRYLLVAAQLYMQKGDTAGCHRLTDQAVAAAEGQPPAVQARVLGYAGSVYMVARPVVTDKAYAVYQKLLQLQPDNVDALNQMAWLLAVEMSPPQIEQALAFSTKAYQTLTATNRFSPTAVDTHGWVLVLAGKPAEGAEVLKRVVAQAPSIEAHYHLGQALLKSGKLPESNAQFELASTLISESDKAEAPVDPALREWVRKALEQGTVKVP